MRAGHVTRWELRHNFARLFPDVYVRNGATVDACGLAKAAAHWAKGDGVLVGTSASALHGARWIDHDAPAEIARRSHCKPPPGILVRRDSIPADEICCVGDFRCTTPARTAFDLGRRLERDAAVVALDDLCHTTGLHPKEIAAVAESHRGVHRIGSLRNVLELVDGGAESPPESRTRLLLIDDGLPPPTTQIVVRDGHGRFVARVDMGWEEWKVAVEYDGVQHWTDPVQRAKDLDRIPALEALGWILVRIGAHHLRSPWVGDHPRATSTPCEWRADMTHCGNW